MGSEMCIRDSLNSLIVEKLMAVGRSEGFLSFVEGSESTDHLHIGGSRGRADFLLRCHVLFKIYSHAFLVLDKE